MTGTLLFGGMTANRGGKESFIMSTFRALLDDYECWFLADQRIAYQNEILDLGGHVRQITPRGQSPGHYLADLARLFSDIDFDVVWLNQTVVNSIEPLAFARLHGVPIRILHSHSSANMGSRLTGILHKMNRPLVPAVANRRFACSTGAGEWFFGRQTARLVPNAFEVEQFTFDPAMRALVREELGVSEHTLVVVQVAAFLPVKNHEFTLRILEELAGSGRDAVIVFAGDGPLRPSIESRAETMGLGPRVRSLGAVTDVARYLQAADVALLPSHFEGLPYTILEAQAAGLPTVASEAVTREADITGTVKFLPLDDGPAAWSAAILQLGRDAVRQSGANPLRGTDYDASRQRALLRQLLAGG